MLLPTDATLRTLFATARTIAIIGAKDGVPNFGYSFGKVSLLLLIPVAIAFVLALLYPKHDPKAGK